MKLNKPTWNKKPVRSPLLALIIWVWILALLIPTLPLHIVKYLFDGKGFLSRRPGHWDYQPGYWTIPCLIAVVVAVLILI